ncbi:MAG: hypothetical protein ACO280_12670 [Pseudohongiellaceae bacterium]
MTGIDQDDVLGSIQPQILTITHDLLKFALGEMVPGLAEPESVLLDFGEAEPTVSH